MAPRTLIAVVHASTGSGQRLAAEAVSSEIASLGADAVTVEALDLAEIVPGWCLRATDGFLSRSPLGRRTLGALSGLLAAAGRPLAEKLAAMAPAAVVCTHPLAALIAGRGAHTARYRVMTAEADFGLPGLTPRTGISLHCVADENAEAELVRRGVPASAVSVTGVPIRPQFSIEYDTAAARAHFGLPAEQRILLALVGSGDPDPDSAFTESLTTALPALAGIPTTAVVVVAGRDEGLASRLRSRSAGFTNTNVHVFEYVEYMAPLMATADLALARPSGLVCAECAASGLPLVALGPTSGRERANVRALLDAGAGIYDHDPRTITEQARGVLADGARLARMREAAGGIARPFAAASVARHAVGLAGVATDAEPQVRA